MKALIGVDIGTQGTKGALFTPDGECLAQHFCASDLHRPGPGIVEEDPERQFKSVCTVVRQCVKKSRVGAGDVACIGIDGQMAGVIGIDRAGRNVTPYDSWLDTRCSPQIKQMESRAGDEVLASNGCAASFNHGPKILWWKQQRPRVYRKIARFVQPGGYAVMRLCGLSAKDAFIDKTYLHFSGFSDNPGSRWNHGLCDAFEIDQAVLPRIVNSHSIVGELSAGSARACGLKPGVPLVAGCGDTAASFLACGAVAEGIGVDVAGTASVFATTTRQFRADLKHRTLGCGQSVVPGLWHPYAYINGGGLNLEWFRRELGRSLAKPRNTEIAFDDLNRRAATLANSDDLPLFIPHLEGRVCPSQPHMRGGWIGLLWEHGAAHMYRAVLEGVALEYAAYMRIVQELFGGAKLRQLRITGGGEKSELWNQIKADVLQTDVVRIAHSAGAPQGAALLAAWGVGLVPDLVTGARKWVALGDRTRPQKAHAKHYERRLARYRCLLDCLDAGLRNLE